MLRLVTFGLSFAVYSSYNAWNPKVTLSVKITHFLHHYLGL